MTRKFLSSLCMLIVLTLSLFGTAAAKSQAEITGINAYDIDKDILRLEIAFSGNLTQDNISTRLTGNIFSVTLNDTSPGRISKLSGAKVDGSNFVKKITVKEAERGNTRVRVILTAAIDEDAFKISVQPANRADKIPARVVVDIRKDAAGIVEEDSDDEEQPAFKVGDKVIVIDAGHGGSDVGAVGPTGLTEKEVTLAVALKVEKILKAEGMKVVMTRRTDTDVAAPGASNTAELQARVDKVPPQANLFISIHCNAFTNPKSNGMETFHYGGSPEGQRLAKILNEELAKFGGLNNRGVKAANFYVIKRTKCPASLIELAFITNPKEEKLLADSKYQKKIAGAIANAVKRFFMN